MADNTLTCEIVTPVKTVFASEATYVGLPGEIGSFGVMQRHEPLVSALKAGVVNVTAADGKHEFVLSGGYAQVNDNKVIVLANDALEVSQIKAGWRREGTCSPFGRRLCCRLPQGSEGMARAPA